MPALSLNGLVQQIGEVEAQHERHQRARQLSGHQPIVERFLVEWAAHEENEVEDGEIVDLHPTLRVLLEFTPMDEAQSTKERHTEAAECAEPRRLELGHTHVEETRLGGEARQSVPRARHKFEELWRGIEKVEDLKMRNE